MVDFNINEKVRVKLTPYGSSVYGSYIESIDYAGQEDLLGYAHEKAKPDANGYNQFQMWQLMAIFGEHMYNGAENVFEKNIIEIDI